MLRLRSLLASTLLCAAFVGSSAGCGGDLPESGQAPIATGQLDEAMSFVEVGQTLVVEVELREEDGSKASFRWVWDEPESDLYERVTTVDKGRLVVEFTPRVPGRFFLSGRAEVERAGGKTDIFALAVADTRAWGGPASHPLPAHAAVDLLVGESRPTFAFPMTEVLGAVPYRSIGAGPVEYQTADSGIATVNARGELRGVAAGETTLTMSYGGQTSSIPVRVKEGSIGAPPPGPYDLNSELALDLSSAWTHASPNDRMAVDEQGFPAFVAVVNPHPGGEGSAQLVLARWTGSGWGLQLVSRPFDDPKEARLAIDDSGAVQLLYSSDFVRSKLLNRDEAPGERSFVAGSEAANGYLHLDLPNVLDGAEDAELLNGFGEAFAIAANPLGGGYASYTSRGIRRQEDSDGSVRSMCMDHLHLVSFSSEGSRDQLVLRREIDRTELEGGECPDTEASNVSGVDPMLAVDPAGGGEGPLIYSSHLWDRDCMPGDYKCFLPVTKFEANGGRYEGSNVLRSFDFDDATEDNNFPYYHLSLARDLDGEAASLLIGLDNTTGSATSGRTAILRPDGTATWYPSTLTLGGFGLRRDGIEVASGSTVGTMHVVHEDGLSYADPAQHNFDLPDGLAEQLEAGAIRAWAASDESLYLLRHDAGTLSLHTATLPQQLVSSDDVSETTGVRLGSGARTPAVYAPPVVFPDGSRVVLGRQRVYNSLVGVETEDGARLLSGGPNQSFEHTAITGSSAIDLSKEPIFRAGTNLYTMAGGQLHRSTNKGQSFTAIGATAADDAWVIHPDGRFAGLQRSGSTWTLFIDSNVNNGFSPVPGGAVSFGSSRPGIVFGEDGSVYVARARGNLIDLVEFVNGVAQGLETITLPSGSTALARQFVVASDGDLIMPFFTSESSGDPRDPVSETMHVAHRNSSNGAVTTRELGSLADAAHAQGATTSFVSLALIRLGNGDLALAWTSMDRSEFRRRAVVSTSSNGTSWRAPVELHPTGGGGQLFVGMASQSNGDILAVISDNSALSGDISNATQLDDSPQGLDAPRMEDILVRVSPP